MQRYLIAHPDYSSSTVLYLVKGKKKEDQRRFFKLLGSPGIAVHIAVQEKPMNQRGSETNCAALVEALVSFGPCRAWSNVSVPTTAG